MRRIHHTQWWSGVYVDSLTVLLSLILFSQLKALVTCGENVVLLLNGKLEVFLASEGLFIRNWKIPRHLPVGKFQLWKTD